MSEWTHVAVALGTLDATGQRQLTLIINSRISSDDAIPWCEAAESDMQSLIQGVVINSNVLVSPIEVHAGASALSIKELQRRFYQQRSSYRHRRGPSEHDDERLNSQLSYDVAPFDSPFSLIAPAIISQDRADRVAQCPFALSEAFHDLVWRTAVEKIICDGSHACSAGLRNSSVALLGCTADSSPKHFFGTESGTVIDDHFSEFLQSIAEAQLVVRYSMEMQENEMFPTETFLGTQTRSAKLTLVMFAPQPAVATVIDIDAEFDVTVQVSHEVSHLTALNGDALRSFVLVCIVGIIFSIVSGVRIFLKMLFPNRFGRYLLGSLISFIDFVMLGVLPTAYLVMMMQRAGGAETRFTEAAGELLDVPWQSSGVSDTDKIASYSSGMQNLRHLMNIQAAYRSFGMIVGICLMLRLTFATDAHPRIGVLVRTLWVGLDDLWHFLISLS